MQTVSNLLLELGWNRELIAHYLISEERSVIDSNSEPCDCYGVYDTETLTITYNAM